MRSTMTVTELAEKVLGHTMCSAVDRVDLGPQALPSANKEKMPVKSIDDLAGEHLSVDLVKALSRIDLRATELGASFELQDLRINVRGRGVLIMLLIVWVASSITDVNPWLHFIQALVSVH